MRGLLGSPSGIRGANSPARILGGRLGMGEQERQSDSHSKSTELGAQRLCDAKAVWPWALAGSPVPWSHPMLGMDLTGRVLLGTLVLWASPDPAAIHSWGWTLATLASLPVRQGSLPIPVLGALQC